MPKEYIYTLDLALNSTGVCIFTDDGKFVKAITIDTHAEKETPLKLRIIGDKFDMIMKEYTPKEVIIEKGFSRYNLSTQQVFRVHGLVNYLFSEYPQTYIAASTIKKDVAGKGNVSKDVVKTAIEKKYKKIKFNNMDESDAFALGVSYFKRKGIVVK